ncbi:serine hydrolase [Mucilaginibacter sp. CAU 1740]|uniref:serine hydrolase n=1 Tax=Mucilaginibacter sp. CAU 1740 TaxID=3140365 RepID=UPI00325B927C
MKKAILLFLIALFAKFEATAQNREQSLKNLIEDANLPGLQLTYNKNGKVVTYVVGTGKEHNTKPLTKTTVLRAGSLGKCVFAYAVMKLYDRGVIALDTPLLNYIGNYVRFDPANPGFKKITARMVLSHTSGLGELKPSADIKADLLFEPGRSFAYSGEGFWFLQKVVESLLNKPFEQIMREEVFSPLGMKNSTYVQTPTMDKNLLGEDPLNFAWLSPNAAFTLFTTSEDYNRFLTALLAGKDLKPETQKQMFTKQSDAQRFNSPVSVADQYVSWGLGLGLQQNEKGKAIWQWGNYGDDFYSFFIAYPKTKESLVFFTRGQSALKIADQVVNLILGKQKLWAMKWLNIGYTYPETMSHLYDLLRKMGWANTSQLFSGMQRSGYQFSEGDINGYGYVLLKQKRFARALSIFKQNIRLFPNSTMAYDSYAEAWMDIGNKKLAIENFQRSLKLDTNNTNAVFRIKSLNYPYKLTPKVVQIFAGKFVQKDRKDVFMIVSGAGNKLKLTDNEGGVIELSQIADNEFYNFDLPMHLKFIANNEGKFNQAIINNVLIWIRAY